MRSVVQLLGVLLLTAGGVVLWSPWALVIAGGVLVLGPELLAIREAVGTRDSRRPGAGA